MTDKSLVHLVFGGELKDIDAKTTEFINLKEIQVVGFFPNFMQAEKAWKAASQKNVDNARMRYFIVHLHKYVDILNT